MYYTVAGNTSHYVRSSVMFLFHCVLPPPRSVHYRRRPFYHFNGQRPRPRTPRTARTAARTTARPSTSACSGGQPHINSRKMGPGARSSHGKQGTFPLLLPLNTKGLLTLMLDVYFNLTLVLFGGRFRLSARNEAKIWVAHVQCPSMYYGRYVVPGHASRIKFLSGPGRVGAIALS